MNPESRNGVILVVLFLFATVATTSFAQTKEAELLPDYDPNYHIGAVGDAPSVPWRLRTVATAAPSPYDTNDSCTSIDFEGIGDQAPVPTFDGISSPDWLGIIDADAGGTGNFAFEPSPSTIAFWLGGATGTGTSRDIEFSSQPAARVSFHYASFVPVQLQAFDASGSVVGAATGPANFDVGPGGDPTGSFNQWDPISVESSDNDIVRIRVSGAVNQTGIDNLQVCRSILVDTIEITQASQEI